MASLALLYFLLRFDPHFLVCEREIVFMSLFNLSCLAER
ncbi:hypothetical protein VDIAB_270843 [Vibrio diabolicus]|nr:hypothetical protein VDIAB_270843 [Vibrio diabolicus]